MSYQYRMVQIPQAISVTAKEARGQEAAHYLQSVANQEAQNGWEFYRVDTIGVATRPGCLGAILGAKTVYIEYYVVTFRRAV